MYFGGSAIRSLSFLNGNATEFDQMERRWAKPIRSAATLDKFAA